MLEKLIGMILEKSFQVSDSPTFKLASGKLSNYYINCKLITLNPEGKYLIGNIIFNRIRDIMVDAIGGLSLGADPIADAVSLISYLEKKPIKAFYVRKKTKDHGIIKKIEGDVHSGEKVVVVDDVITTGSSTIEAINCAREKGLEVVKVIVLVDREEGGRENIIEHIDEFESIITRTLLMEAFNARHSKKEAVHRQTISDNLS